jgi:hypothetical protein
MAGEQRDAVAIPSHKPIAIVLDFMTHAEPWEALRRTLASRG